MTPAGFPHSEFSGSKLVCSSPELIAAYHVLRRLLTPRHPPSALSSLIEILGARSQLLQRTRRTDQAIETAVHISMQLSKIRDRPGETPGASKPGMSNRACVL